MQMYIFFKWYPLLTNFNKNKNRMKRLTFCAKSPQQAGTASTLKTALPTTVPTPMSPSVMNVPTTLIKRSGLDTTAAMKVAPTTSSDILKSVKGKIQ